MFKRWVSRYHFRFNSSVSGFGPASHTTPYSDKYYQPIISEGFKGFDKLIIPKDFKAANQDLDVPEKSKQLENLKSIINSFESPIKVSIGYGSGVFPQIGYEKENNEETQIDFINIVENNDKFHKQNLKQHPSHYSVKFPFLIRLIQGKSGIYFNPFVKTDFGIIKYGIISKNTSLIDLSEWSSLYFAGRLHKPVNFIKDEDEIIKFLNQFNLKNAMTLSILLIEKNQFSEIELYEQITSLSYLGDFRMYIGGENPNKVKNIVDKQFLLFKKLYEPILEYFIHRNILVITDNNEINRTFRKNLTINNKIKLISTLPLQFRIKLYKMYQEKSIKEIVKDKDLGNNLIKVISKTITTSSIKQAIKGFFSSGIIKSLKYAIAKQVKFWRGKFNERK